MNIHKIKSYIDSLYCYGIPKLTRRLHSNRDINTHPYQTMPLSKKQKDEIKSIWNKYNCLTSKSFKWFEFYNFLTGGNQNISLYIPEDVYYSYVDLFFTNPVSCLSIDDKNHYDLFFRDSVKMPATIVRKMNNRYLDSEYKNITLDQAIKLITDNGDVILKSSRNSMSGEGIRFWNSKENSISDLMRHLDTSDNLVIQEIIRQHHVLSELNASSINTIRIMTLFDREQPEVISSVLRMGTGTAKVDNAHSGGIVSGIMKSGMLRNEARNLYGQYFPMHPNGIVLGKIIVPGYHKCVEKALELAPRFVCSSRLISWDFSVDENESPILVEVNLSYGGIDVHQLCNGPLFGEDSLRILNMVFNK